MLFSVLVDFQRMRDEFQVTAIFLEIELLAGVVGHTGDQSAGTMFLIGN